MIGAIWDWLTTNGVGQNVLGSVIWVPITIAGSHLFHNKRIRKMQDHFLATIKQQHEITRRQLADALGGDEPAPAPLPER